MTLPTIFQYDAITVTEHVLPLDVQAAGYDTGFNIAWTQEQYDRHTQPYPAVHIDQDPNATDYLADILDVESGAATEEEMIRWLNNARANFAAKKRLGQRWPGIYCSFNNVTSAVGVLTNAHVTNVPFWVADYSISSDEAQRRVATAIGTYPAIGYQYSDKAFGGLADQSWMNENWLKITNKQLTGGTVNIPGWQGTWLTFNSLPAADGSVVGFGIGTNGS